ncbi:MAG TPA: CPBP family intramembrane glutamic endopeptidase [Candidatus Saccharimonadales bacterium]|nr:CPBP family intramembrane glutamic endopeptidase [Candidatus Saccharimonadales bacterium]
MAPLLSTAAPLSIRSRIATGSAVVAILMILNYLQNGLALIPAYRGLYERWPFYVPESGKSLLQILLVVGAASLVSRRPVRDATRDLGFLASIGRGAAFGLGSVAVMIVGFAATTSFHVPSDLPAVIYLAGLSPLAEEVLYRAFGVGTLRHRCGAPVWLALALPAIVFGLGHVEKGAGWSQSLALFALTGSGGLFFGWFYLRWRRNLWAPFFLHAGMNLSWQIFQVGDNAVAGWWPFALQAAAIVAGILATVRFAPKL